VAQRRALAAREDRRPLPAEEADHPVPDGVDPAVHEVQPARLDPLVDHGVGQPAGEELTAGDHPALAAGEAADDEVRGDLCVHTTN
jgi:hypothetical protein